MKIFSKCEGCKKNKFFIRKRVYKHSIGRITSQSLLCGSCFKGVKRMLKK